MAGPLFWLSRQVELVDTDMAGIVHFSNYFRYMEAAEHAMLRESGMPFATPGASPEATLLWPRVKATCEYLAPLRFGETVWVGARVTRLGRGSLSYGMEIRRQRPDGELAGRGELTVACVKRELDGGIRSVPIPEPWRRALQAYLDDAVSPSGDNP
jgi:YbgC/YbaW family acyl-CoA thioester hydrolase